MKNWAWYTLSAHAPNYVPLDRYGGVRSASFVPVWRGVEHSIAIFSSKSTRRGQVANKDVSLLEAVFFAVKVEAGDGM